MGEVEEISVFLLVSLDFMTWTHIRRWKVIYDA
ncbi:hypothetical protein LCGC14_1542380 [marine sediment metagenome]|uniref:Uncharacterized protein n=1 Tax=marine sediment metagenome TaxID=412755 RepID=A0A0F9JDN2_9ZZZZ